MAGSDVPHGSPGPVVPVHRLLIAVGLAAALVYGAWEAREYARTGAGSHAVGAGLGFGVAVVIGWYFRTLRHLPAKLSGKGPR